MWYDVFVLAILIVGMVRGAVRGVIWQLAGIAGIVLCLVFAETISAVGSPLVNLEPPLDQWVVMFVAYLFFSFLSFGFARLLNSAIEKAQLKEYNKHLGAIFGLVKGLVLCLVITFFLVTLSETTRGILKDSKSARYAAIIMDRLHPVMPQKLRGALVTYIEDLDVPDLDLRYAGGSDDEDASEQEPWIPPTDNDPTGAVDSATGAGPSTGDGSAPISVTGEALDALLRQIPGLAHDAWTRETAKMVYEATPPASRQRLLEELKSAGPAMLLAVLQHWQAADRQPDSQGTDSGTGGPVSGGSAQHVGHTEPSAPSRESLISSIAAALARQPQDQPAYEQYIDQGVQGLPDIVLLDVLQDWQADLTPGVSDPDPQTNAATSLDQRIIRQLTLHRVSVYQLSQALQSRLMQARNQ